MPEIKNFPLEELSKILQKHKSKPYLAFQIFNWIYKKNACSFSEMTDIAQTMREWLSKHFTLENLKAEKHLISNDLTEKFLFRLKDSNKIETVLIPAENRLTLCISTQAGCKFKCKFCVSGRDGFLRNLSTSEIVSQFTTVNKVISPRKITNVVFMGSGEPLDNFKNVRKAVEILLEPKGAYLGKRKICLSTCGIVPKIYEFAKAKLGIKLSISLHSTLDEKRSRIMPINKKYPVKELLKAAKYFVRNTKSAITFEYILISGFNCTKEDARHLAKSVKGINCKINIIPYNPSRFFPWRPPNEEEVFGFRQVLEEANIFYTLRKPRGRDIEGACGQLKNEVYPKSTERHTALRKS